MNKNSAPKTWSSFKVEDNDEFFSRKRLERSGLWDWKAKSKEKLVITRIKKDVAVNPD